MKKVKEWFGELLYSVLFTLALLLAYVHKLRTGENIISELNNLMIPAGGYDWINGVAEANYLFPISMN